MTIEELRQAIANLPGETVVQVGMLDREWHQPEWLELRDISYEPHEYTAGRKRMELRLS